MDGESDKTMDDVLQQINTVPGVIGSLVCGAAGEVVAHAFPPLFDLSILQGVAGVVADPGSGVRNSAGAFDLVDLRYQDGRIVVKPLEESFLLLLGTKAINLQVLTISLNVAKGKLEALGRNRGDVVAAAAAAGLPGVLTLPACHIQNSAIGSSFEQFGMAAITPATAQQIGAFYKTGTVKKLKLTSPSSGLSGVFAVMVVNESDDAYDGKIILCKTIERKLKVSADDLLSVELP
ncbi:roadblock/LC7 domain-containing protein [Geobacter sp.]|uniref:roadblock/LC7 domain-containing protein n=1 Tax=Geobacter sp. TaxID=46610 RepID=UPI002635DF87|nr:roadblock/LC7 domain-containing protein [Geobacter sp.]